MMLKTTRKVPLQKSVCFVWFDRFGKAKRETNARRRSEYHLRKSGNTSLKSSGTIDLSRTSTGSNNTLTVPVPQINVPSSSMLDV